MNLTPTALRALLAQEPALEFQLLNLAQGKPGETDLSPSVQGIIAGSLLTLAIQASELPSDELDHVLIETLDALRQEAPRDLQAEPWKSLEGWTLTLRDAHPCLTGRDETGKRVVTSPLLQFTGANLAVTLRSVYRLGTPA